MCALSLSPDFFVRCLLDRFHVLDLLTFAGRDVRLTRSVLDVENEQAMMEGALALICTLLTTRTMLAASDQEITKYVLSAEEWGGGERKGWMKESSSTKLYIIHNKNNASSLRPRNNNVCTVSRGEVKELVMWI